MIALSPPPVLLPFLSSPMFLCRNLGRLLKVYCTSTAPSSSITEANWKTGKLFAAFCRATNLLYIASFGKNDLYARPILTLPEVLSSFSGYGVFQDRVFHFVLIHTFTLAVTKYSGFILMATCATIYDCRQHYFFFSFLYGLQSGLHGWKRWLPKVFLYQQNIDALVSYISHCVCNHNKPSFSSP